MKTKVAKSSPATSADYINAQSVITGLQRKDLIDTVRSVATHGLRHPLHASRHALALGGRLGRVMLGDTLFAPDPSDTRFNDPTWALNPLYKRGLQAYLSCQQGLQEWLQDSQLDEQSRIRAGFLFALLDDAIAPSNTLLNPQAIKEVFNSGGLSLLRGARHLLADLRHHQGLPRQVPPQAFEVGKQVATTPGAVVLRNEVLELIQYGALSEKQHKRPLLVVPSPINRFYIFDLSPANSFVQYALKHNLQVFMVSWRNPTPRHREWGLSRYVQALEEALDACRAISASREVNLVGGCTGGLINAALQSVLQRKRQLGRVQSASYFVSLLDAHLEGPASLFLGEEALESAKRRSYQLGVLDGRELARWAALARPNELIWRYWVNNYLLGREPEASDVLYWANDTTRLPAALHGDLLDLFKHNPLPRPGALEVCGTPVDLSLVGVDTFTVAALNDQITPWDSIYRSSQLLGGTHRLVLSSGGHVRGMLAPPGRASEAWYLENPKLSGDPRAWYYDATRHEGSWWAPWLAWVQERSGPLRAPITQVGSEKFPALGAAPGTYVLGE
ncbi:class II poly(R)-hydroxyalkanoic acid synthase [Pseudomonas japonica]|uniref:class II poly(R)-hydroxyalkanoic acid synthase n=1 Tax=Pseudomonas japonica TaxID=256466 RepID=UPI0015E31D3A|nr:class II poly(R)-hydroxyalkanoic acid synthase [Pseudomonas japonica]MBA1241243.1 class II poly(R)-hydroxyalkanoic acid synthase [Pseudomonas japonica]